MKPVISNARNSNSIGSTAASVSSIQLASSSLSGAVFHQCTVVVGSQPPVAATKLRRHVIESDDEDGIQLKTT